MKDYANHRQYACPEQAYLRCIYKKGQTTGILFAMNIAALDTTILKLKFEVKNLTLMWYEFWAPYIIFTQDITYKFQICLARVIVIDTLDMTYLGT